MMRSAFVRRQLFLVIAAVIITSALTTMVYSVYTRNLLAAAKSDELSAAAQRVAQWMETPGWGSSWLMELRDSFHLLDARFVIYQSGEYPEYFLMSDPAPERMPPQAMVDAVFLGKSVQAQPSLAWRTGSLTVGQPVTDLNRNVVYAVFLIKSTAELSVSVNAMNPTMIGTMLAAIGFMLLPTCVGAWLVARPIYQMRDVALRMARGDFSARANEHIRGEIGELGATLNYLSERLSETIGALQLEQQRLLSIVDGLGEGILAIDGRGEITHVNPALIRIFNMDADWAEVFEDESLREDFRMTVETRVPLVRSMHVRDMILRVTITPLESENGTSDGAVGLFRDVTEQERLEQTRRDYVANVSHELRTPVSSIRGLAEALHDGLIKEDEDKQRYYGFILRESMRLSRLIEDLLELSRLQSGTVALKMMKVDLRELLMDFHEQYSQTANDVGITFTLELPDGCAWVYTNPDRIEQVLVALFDNAVKNTSSDGLITVGARQVEESMLVYVRDTGVGIDPVDIGHVFERFYKADKAHTGQGTGLGLSIVRELILRLGGEISVQSELGKGAEFMFTIARWHEDETGSASNGTLPERVD